MWDQRLKLYDQIVDKCPNIERKGKSVPYTSANGYMFSFINKAGELGFRFSKTDQEAFFEKHQSTYFKSHDAVMKGYVLIPEDMFEELDLLAEYLNKSYAHVMTLKPK